MHIQPRDGGGAAPPACVGHIAIRMCMCVRCRHTWREISTGHREDFFRNFRLFRGVVLSLPLTFFSVYSHMVHNAFFYPLYSV